MARPILNQYIYNEQLFIVRYLDKKDAKSLYHYFLYMLNNSKKWYSPHSFAFSSLVNICKDKNDLNKHFIITLEDIIVAYGILTMEYRYWEKYRLKDQFKDKEVCEIAPSVVDSFQGIGLGTILVNTMKNVAKQYHKKYMLLWGGVVIENEPAIKLYSLLASTLICS